MTWLALSVCCLLPVAGSLVLAQTGTEPSAPLREDYDLSWWTVDGGGQASDGGSYQLTGTARQPDAGAMSGGGYSLRGGFWARPRPDEPFRLYLPAVLRE
jgi:hypothetical protein